jgi:hypothetical protein
MGGILLFIHTSVGIEVFFFLFLQRCVGMGGFSLFLERSARMEGSPLFLQTSTGMEDFLVFLQRNIGMGGSPPFIQTSTGMGFFLPDHSILYSLDSSISNFVRTDLFSHSENTTSEIVIS